MLQGFKNRFTKTIKQFKQLFRILLICPLFLPSQGFSAIDKNFDYDESRILEHSTRNDESRILEHSARKTDGPVLPQLPNLPTQSRASEVDLSSPENQRQVISDTKSLLRELLANASLEKFSHLQAQLLVFGHKENLYKRITQLVNRLSLPEDPSFSFFLSPSPIPNAKILLSENKMTINLGLLILTPNEDALAYVIAHEMTHANIQLHKAKKTNHPEADQFLQSLPSYNDMKPSQREELRADLGAIDRLIKAGYNPWAAYNFEKDSLKYNNNWSVSALTSFRKFRAELAERSFQSTHPLADIRASTVKAYILQLEQVKDISEHISRYTEFDNSLKLLRKRMQIFSLAAMKGAVSISFVSILLSVLPTDYLFLNEIRDYINNSLSHPVLVNVFIPVIEYIFHVVELSGNVLRSDAFRAGVSSFMLWLMFLLSMDIYKGVTSVMSHSSKEEFQNLKRLYRELFSEFKTQMNGRQSQVITSSRLINMMDMSIEALKIIDQLYQNDNSTFHIRRKWIHRIGIIRHYTQRLTSSLIDMATSRAPLLGAENHTQFVTSILNSLAEIPNFVLTNVRVRTAVNDFLFVIGKFSSSFSNNTTQTYHTLKQKVDVLVKAESISSKSTPEEQYLVSKKLVDNGFYSEAEVILQRHFKSIIDYVFSSAAPEEYAALLIEAINAIRAKRTVPNSQSVCNILCWEYKLFSLQVASQFSQTRRILALALNQSVHRITDLSPRHALEVSDALFIKQFFFKNFNSLSEIHGFVKAQLMPNNIQLNALSSVFYKVVVENPHFIRSPRDLEVLINNEYFWPQWMSDFGRTKYESEFLLSLNSLREKYPELWKFEPSSSEILQRMYVDHLKRMNREPVSFEEKMKLWETLVSKGVTYLTDSLFLELYQTASKNPDLRNKKYELELAAYGGKIWETEIKGQISYETLVKDADKRLEDSHKPRAEELRELLRGVENNFSFTERGGYIFSNVLEQLSQTIHSRPSESDLIESRKRYQGEKGEDFILRFFSSLLTHVLSWKKQQQWNFILFLRHESDLDPSLKDHFSLIGVERVRRMFSLLPIEIKTQLLDSMLDSPKGLIPSFSVQNGYTRIIIEHLLKDSSPEARAISLEIMNAFLYSLDQTGNGGFKSYILSYLLAIPKNQSQSGSVLKNILEVYGTTGIKIGQFLAVSGILLDSEAKHLRVLQEKANLPNREYIYSDLRYINGGENLPLKMQSLLGAASLKYVVSAQQDGEPVVLKILRKEAIANTQLQFKQLDAMADYLIENYGSKRYGIFKSIVKSSQSAVTRELSLDSEVQKSKKAKEHLYTQPTLSSSVKFQVPEEKWINSRLIRSEFAEGVSIFDIPEKYKQIVAREILHQEERNLFRPGSQSGDVIFFDPDRHAGNFRIKINSNGITIYPIDWGQMLSMTAGEREKIFEMFAYAQILARTGSNRFILEKIMKTMGISSQANTQTLKNSLRTYFPDTGLKEVTAYFSLLAALSDIGHQPRQFFFDFIRGIIQLGQYQSLSGEEEVKPILSLKQAVQSKINVILSEMNLSVWEKSRIVLRDGLKNIRMNRGQGVLRKCSSMFYPRQQN